MKKLLSILLAAMLLLGMSSAMAEEVVVNFFGLKIEIDAALKEYAEQYNAAHPGVKVVIENIGGGADYGSVLKSKNQAGELPQILQIEGKAGYMDWKDYAVVLNDEAFVKNTTLSYVNEEGNVVGFPVAIEGYGLAYNKDMLDKAGIDPATLNTRQNIQAAFEKLDSMKAELGIDAVVSAAASLTGEMWWSMGQHVFSTYLSGGLPYGDRSVMDMALEGKVDEARMKEFAEYVALLMKYSDHTILSTGNYDAQIRAFATGKTAFLTQGNWADPNLKELGATFTMGYAPHAFLSTEDNGIQLNPPSWYLVTNTGTEAQIKAAIDFLNSMATTPEGQEYMVKKAGMVPAFSGIELKPEGQLSLDLMAKNEAGGNHNWFFGELPSGFGQNVVGPIMDFYAQNPDSIDVDALATDLAGAIAKIPSMLGK